VLLKIAGPGLPSGGVPVNNLNDPSIAGTPAEVDQYGAWKFVWYAANVQGIEKLKTGRYTFTATDAANPDKSATALFMLKKPEYSVIASPNPVNPGKYIELIGTAEQGISFAKIDIADSSGRVLHTYTSPVSSSGYFSYGFHVDMDPGQYPVTVSNPGLTAPFGTVISVVPEGGAQPVTTMITPKQVSVFPTDEVTGEITTARVTGEITTGPAPEPSPTKSPVTPVTILAALMVCVIGAKISRRP
jgi:hypothetical protein